MDAILTEADCVGLTHIWSVYVLAVSEGKPWIQRTYLTFEYPRIVPVVGQR